MQKKSFREIGHALKKKPMILALLMGFSSGLPLLLTLRTLQAWMTEANVDLKTIGLFAFVGTPYSWKFLWAPFVDRFQLSKLGRRRSWLLASQIILVALLLFMATLNPQNNIHIFAGVCILVAFWSATQDIVIDAFRRETLLDEEQGIGSTLYIYGYRIAMWISGAGALALATALSWNQVYTIMACFVALCIVIPLWAEEPVNVQVRQFSFIQSFYLPLKDFFKRQGSFLVLCFILLYKVGDTIAGSMATPFYLKLGFEKIDIAAIAKTLSLPAVLIGGAIGGIIVFRFTLKKSLFIIGIFQMLSTAGFAWLAEVGINKSALAAVVIFEDISGAMGSAALTAFIALLTKREFTATQFALLTSLISLPRTLLSAPSGYWAESLGWSPFFMMCASLGIPALILIPFLNTRSPEQSASSADLPAS